MFSVLEMEVSCVKPRRGILCHFRPEASGPLHDLQLHVVHTRLGQQALRLDALYTVESHLQGGWFPADLFLGPLDVVFFFFFVCFVRIYMVKLSMTTFCLIRLLPSLFNFATCCICFHTFS